MTAVLRHELSSYFTNVTGYVFGAFLLLFAGIYTMVINLQSASPYFEYVLMNMDFIFLIIVPILTMRVIAEERRQKTDQLLYSLPLTMTQVALGKIPGHAGHFPHPGGRHRGVSPGAHCLRGCVSSGGLRRSDGFLLPGSQPHRHWHVYLIPDGEPGSGCRAVLCGHASQLLHLQPGQLCPLHRLRLLFVRGCVHSGAGTHLPAAHPQRLCRPWCSPSCWRAAWWRPIPSEAPTSRACSPI